MYTCASCQVAACRYHQGEKPKNCPCLDTDIIDRSVELLQQEENLAIARNSAMTEAEGYGRLTRLQEIILFCQKMGYKKIGLAFCVGLRREAEIFSRVLRNWGLEVHSVVCKCGDVPKMKAMGLTLEQTVRQDPQETMCNPIGQALLLAEDKTDFNIMLGLCVGHDTLFMKYSEAPATVFAVKDRVLVHNPIAAVYAADYYYKNKLTPPEKK